jgi:hypothetical protein
MELYLQLEVVVTLQSNFAKMSGRKNEK